MAQAKKVMLLGIDAPIVSRFYQYAQEGRMPGDELDKVHQGFDSGEVQAEFIWEAGSGLGCGMAQSRAGRQRKVHNQVHLPAAIGCGATLPEP